VLRSAAARELAVVVALWLATFALAARLDLFEAFADWTLAHDELDVDEIVVATMVGCLALAVYSWRRHRQAEAESRQRALTEQTLAETTQHYRSLFDYNPHAVFSVGLLGRFAAANAASQRLCGYTAEEINAMDVGALILPSHAAATAEAFEQAVNRQPQQLETALRHKDGRLVDVYLTGLPIVVDDEVVGVYCIAEDITERKKMERKLMRTQIAAERANEAKSLFLANVSHEIRTPLTTLLGTNEVLMDTELDPLQARFVETMQRSGERLLGLVSDILDFSAMQGGEASLALAEFDVAAVAAEVAERTAAAAEAKGLAFELVVEPDLPSVLVGDPARVAQLLTHLLENAVKFTEQGGVRVWVGVAGSRHGVVDARLVVQDTGIGISSEHQGRLFESFSQADASITRKYSGTGLGLALCNQLVDLMEGSIAVRSTLGEGSAFTVVLPFGLPTEAQDASSTEVSPGQGATLGR
jgi:PAS domain S-box-containing protein